MREEQNVINGANLGAQIRIQQPTPQEPIPQEYRPSNQQLLQEYDLKIEFLSKGCIVRVGCKSIAFESVENAMKEVNEYVNNTYETQNKWRKLLDA